VNAPARAPDNDTRPDLQARGSLAQDPITAVIAATAGLSVDWVEVTVLAATEPEVVWQWLRTAGELAAIATMRLVVRDVYDTIADAGSADALTDRAPEILVAAREWIRLEGRRDELATTLTRHGRLYRLLESPEPDRPPPPTGPASTAPGARPDRDGTAPTPPTTG
jgi:hypothetical protein